MLTGKMRLYWYVVALLVLLVLTAPEPVEVICNHTYMSNDGCQTSVCSKCEVKQKTNGRHDYTQINCYERECRRCGLVEEHVSHRNRCDTVGKCADCGSDVPRQGDTHIWNSVKKGCKTFNVCKLCGESELVRENHVWTGTDCHEAVWCGECGIPNPKITKHLLRSPFGGIVTYCARCEYAEFLAPPVDWFLLTGLLLGVLWLLLALAYAVRERRKFFLDRQLLRSALLENQESCIGHCPITPMLRSAEEAPPF